MSKNTKKLETMIKKMETVETIKLTDISHLDNMGEEAAEAVRFFTENSDPTLQRLGTLVNSILTQKNRCFLLSTRLMQHLIRTDPNLNIKSHTHANQRALMHRALKNKFIEILEPPTGQKAGLYKLIEDILVEILSKEHTNEYYMIQEKKARELYHNYKNNDKTNDKTFQDIQGELELKKMPRDSDVRESFDEPEKNI